MDDWAEFLNSRLDEDEAAAKAAWPGPWDFETEVGGFGPVADVLMPLPHEKGARTGLTRFIPLGTQDADTAAHIALHDPARVLREVVAKRAILAGYLKAADDLEDPWVTNALLTALGHHMAVWDDHPDYPAARKSLEEAYWTS